jgi:hypothetical protein
VAYEYDGFVATELTANTDPRRQAANPMLSHLLRTKKSAWRKGHSMNKYVRVASARATSTHRRLSSTGKVLEPVR